MTAFVSWPWLWRQAKSRPISYLRKEGRVYMFCERDQPDIVWLVRR